ncbi:hypothetical protein INN71_07560 [Nocardioides sp. ChNu-153]|uniref:hypothetical protein n=1 Tax=unclassified Nocardioides TaxID=2615069 RepID=UPI002405913F|nr:MULTISPECIES: hypothetical protein [unclassified Nocardioides]MDF9715575.1 hypothetical protein [Nocardioides sp. ChNu-99]MDN7121247.1 hypothetical protein [Nocardioides sp. ChNu-153]
MRGDDTSLFEDLLTHDHPAGDRAAAEADGAATAPVAPAGRRQWLVLVGAVVLLLGSLAGGVAAVRAAVGGEDPGTPVAWRDAVVDGSSVTVTWDASPCADEGVTSVEESADEVVLVVREVPRPALCSSPGQVRQTTVELDEPVGDRTLVDGSTAAR